MTPVELRECRRELGYMWGLGRPLSLGEMAQVLRLAGVRPADTVRSYERGKTAVSGPISLVCDMLLSGCEHPDGIPQDDETGQDEDGDGA